MAIPKFYLKRRANENGSLPEKDIPIELNYSFNGRRLQYYTGLSTDARYFISDYFKTGKLPIKKAAPNSEYINDSLSIIRKYVEEFHLQCKHTGHAPTVQDFRDMLDVKLKGKGVVANEINRAKDAIQPFLDYTESNLAYNTYRNTKSALNHLSNFLHISRNTQLQIEDINQDIYEKFRAYLIKLGHKNNTVVKHLNRFKAFRTWLKEQGYSMLPIKSSLRENDIEVIVLTETELEQLKSAEFPDERSNKVRDVFIFGCYTSLRYGDILKLKKSDISKDGIRFLIEKQGGTVTHLVPLAPESRRILEKYKNYPGEQALPCYTNQKMNQYLKAVMLAAGLTEKITVAEKSGSGTIKRVVKEKWELITCHTSRKTFTTLALSKGMPEAVIKSITGHSKTSKAFSKYYTVSDKLKEQEMKKLFDL